MPRLTTTHSLSRARAGVRVLAVILCAVPGAIAAAGNGDDFERIDEVAVAELLPSRLLRSVNYDVDPVARADTNFYRFRVVADGRRYDITSLAMLRRRLHEIATTASVEARLDQTALHESERIVSRRGVGSEDVIDILADPVGTSAHLLGNLQYNVEQTFVEDGPQPAQQTTPASGRQDLNPGSHKRSAAAQLGVDVYTSNPVMQRVLERAAAARSSGDASGTFSPLLRDPYSQEQFGSGRLNFELQSTLKNFDAAEIQQGLDEDMARMRVPPGVRIAFLTHAAYTPRTRLFFTRYAQLLGDVRGIDALFRAATTATTEADAVAYVGYVRMLAWFQLHGGRLTEVITDARYPTLATATRAAVLALPLDFLAWTEPVAAAADTLRQIMRDHELAAFIVLLAGRPTDRAQAELEARAVTVRPGYSF